MANNDFTPDELKNEEWRDVPDYEGFYMASNLGRIKSLHNRYGTSPEKILKPYKSGSGHLFVHLHNKENNWVFSVHRLVAAAFIGPIKKKWEIHHINSRPDDNRLENLQLIHIREHRRIENTGEKNSQAKLTVKQVKEIRNRYSEGGVTHNQLAQEYGVGRRAIGRAIDRKRWGHVE